MRSNYLGAEWRELERERREKVRELIADWERDYYYPKLKEIRERCEHNYLFSHLGPVGGVWFHCTLCGKGQYRDE